MKRAIVSLVVSTMSGIAADSVEIAGVHNAFRATERIYSGSQPEGDATFSALAKLGVKTIISVDGAKPEVAAAKKHGIRYVHLPIGYDSVPKNRIAELAAAVAGTGNVFVHCHHGKHRGPAAVAVICESTEGWSKDAAIAWMKKAGTSEDYAGLYRAAREFKIPGKAEIAAVGPLPEVAKTPDLVDAMVSIDEQFDALKTAKKAAWPADSANHATLLWEQLRELGRFDDTKSRPEKYRALLSEGEQAALDLRDALKKPDLEKAAAAFRTLEQNCSACHKAFRN